MRKQPDRFKFVLLFGLIISIPLAINYYIFKLLVTFFISSISWDYSLMELLFVSITSIFGDCSSERTFRVKEQPMSMYKILKFNYMVF